MRSISIVLAACLLAGTSGCTRWVEIRPTELPKLNASYNRPAGAAAVYVPGKGMGIAPIHEVSVTKVLRPDGTVARVDGEYDTRVTTRNAREHTFGAPVLAELDPDHVNLTVRGAEQPPKTFSLHGIDRVEVSQTDMAGTVFWLVAIPAVVLTALAFYAIDRNSSD